MAAQTKVAQPMRHPIKPPPIGLAMTEFPRSFWEFSMLPWLMPVLSAMPRGDRHPVLVLPGFLTSDISTLPLRTYIASLGYDVFPWELGRNFGIRTVGEAGEHILERVMELHQTSGRKVSLVGWSLGGIISRQLARQAPDAIRQVITLGSPFTGNPRATNITGLYEKLTGDLLSEDVITERLEEEKQPVPVPSTAIYSKFDGVTSWRNCLDRKAGKFTENIEVFSSHMGLPFNASVWLVIADRLSQQEDRWKRYRVRSFWSMGIRTAEPN